MSSGDFERASELIRALSDRRAPGQRLATVARQPGALACLARVLRAADSVTLGCDPGSDPACAALGSSLTGRVAGIPVGRLARAVLLLPGSRAAYLKGRSRQAVRTALRHAEQKGQWTESVAPADIIALAAEVHRRHGGLPFTAGVRSSLQEPTTRMLAARSKDGEPLAIAAYIQCAHAGRVMLLVAVQDADWSEVSSARYLVHTAVLSTLIDAGVGVVTVGSAMRLEPGLQHWQRVLGYRPAHLRYRRRSTARLRPPGVVSAVSQAAVSQAAVSQAAVSQAPAPPSYPSWARATDEAAP